jgi:hypothetical protein
MQAKRLAQESFSKLFIQRSFESEQIWVAAVGAFWIVRPANPPGLILVIEMMPIRFTSPFAPSSATKTFRGFTAMQFGLIPE